jgi:endonuclease III
MNVDKTSQVVIPSFEMLGFIRAEAVANRPTNFLDLPEDVRIRIYQYSNLIRPCPIDVFEERGRFKSRSGVCRSDLLQKRGPYREPPCGHPAIPLNIFRVSRAVFDDASSALYNRNRFRLTLTYQDDFQRFQEMIKPYYRYLIKSLYVDLRTSDNRILRLKNVSFNTVLRRWEKFCSSVSLTIPRLQDFGLQCRIRDAETARRVLGPMSSFPLLSRCAFYFDPLADNEILGIAKETAYARTLASSTPFQFLSLPVELQFMVMEHLLTCRWDPFVPPRMVSAGQIILRNHKRQRVFEPICCGTCSTSTSTCFCSFRGTVFSTGCSCFTSPVPYFLVCREMYTVAHSVFYSKNQFSLIGSNPRLMMRQVRGLANNSLSMIRHLTFALYGINRHGNFMAPELNAGLHISWPKLLRFLKAHLRLGSVLINFVDLGCPSHSEMVWTAFLRDILRSFVFLRGVRNFQVYLGYDRCYEFIVEEEILGPLHRATAVKSLPFVGSKRVFPIARET